MAISEAGPGRRSGGVWVSALVTVLLLALTDLVLGAWHGSQDRLPAHFSSRYLQRYAVQANVRAGLVVLGDSELWGYGVPAADSPVAQLARSLRGARVANFAYEAGTPINADFVLRYLLACGQRPRAVLVEINPASFNQTAPAYDTLNAALAELAVPALIEPFDRGKLNEALLRRETTPAERIDRFVSDHWLLYGLRVDVHQALFGDADLATALDERVRPILQPARPAAVPSYAAMYDLTPLDPNNVSYAYAEHLFATLAALRIPALVVLPPVNHALLHRYIDNAAYAANLTRVERLAAAHHLRVLNLDARLAASDFIDNTHLNPAGGARLAHALLPHVAPLLDVL